VTTRCRTAVRGRLSIERAAAELEDSVELLG
jgi:hypothetical protein